MSKKLVVSKASIRADISYIRTQLRQAEEAIRKNNWKEAQDIFQEIGAVGATHESSCRDNYFGIERSDYELAYTGVEL